MDEAELEVAEDAFHRAYLRRTAIAYGVVGLALALAGAITIFVIVAFPESRDDFRYASDYNREATRSFDLLILAGAGVVIGIGLVVKAILVARTSRRHRLPTATRRRRSRRAGRVVRPLVRRRRP